MKREEAIKTLKELWRETNDQWYEETYAMAIEALDVMENRESQISVLPVMRDGELVGIVRVHDLLNVVGR